MIGKLKVSAVGNFPALLGKLFNTAYSKAARPVAIK